MTTTPLPSGARALTRVVTGQGPARTAAEAADSAAPSAPSAPSAGPSTVRLNWLRAGVLGANDGIVSVAAVVVGVAGATANAHTIAMAGLAALVGGALSMALGEYVSVASARDSQRAAGADVPVEEIANPWHAALASAVAFVAGALLPFLAVLLIPAPLTVIGTVATVLVALALTGAVGARLGRAPALRPVLRVLVGGSVALALTFAVGSLFGVAVA